MATKAAISEAVKLFNMAYPRQIEKQLGQFMDAGGDDLDGAVDRMIAFYARLFPDVPNEVLLAAAQTHITRSQWWPAVSEWREIAFDILTAKMDIPSPFAAWAEVKKLMRVPSKQRRWSSELIPRAMDGIGGMGAFGRSREDQEMSWRARFYESYRDLVDRERRRVEELPQVEAVRRKAAGELPEGLRTRLVAVGRGGRA